MALDKYAAQIYKEPYASTPTLDNMYSHTPHTHTHECDNKYKMNTCELSRAKGW